MKSMLFAAGLGTRLKPLTDTMPKAMVPVGGFPLIYHTLNRLIDQGASEIVVNVHHFASQIIDYVASRDWGVPVRISDESEALLDTGGGLLQAATLFTPGDEPILIHNVDILSNADLRTFYEANRDCEAALMVSERVTQRYLLFDDEMRLRGWTNLATGEVRSPYPDLDVNSLHRYAFSGIHCFSPRLFEVMKDLGYAGRFPIMDFYLQVCAQVGIRGFVQPDLQLLDVGKLDTLSAAERWLAGALSSEKNKLS